MEEERSEIVLKLKKEDEKDISLDELIYALTTTRKALNNYYKKVCGIKSKKELEKLSPIIVHAQDGCIEIVTIVIGVATGVLANAIYDLIKKGIKVISNQNSINVVYPSQSYTHWYDEEDYLICKKVIEAYVIKGNDIPQSTIVKDVVAFIHNHPLSSIKLKICTTIKMLNNANIKHTAPFKGYGTPSKSHEREFLRVCNEYKLI